MSRRLPLPSLSGNIPQPPEKQCLSRSRANSQGNQAFLSLYPELRYEILDRLFSLSKSMNSLCERFAASLGMEDRIQFTGFVADIY